MHLSDTSNDAMLAEILSASAAECRQRLGLASAASCEGTPKPVVLFGCGPLGRRTAAAMIAARQPPVAFADNNRNIWGTAVCGIPVMPPAEAAAAYGQSAIFVATIYNGSAVRAQLRLLGCRSVLHFMDLYHGLPEVFLPWCNVDDPDATLAARNDVIAAALLWADDASRREYANQIAWRVGRPAGAPWEHDPPAQCYFPNDLFSLAPDALIVDCGAFDGDSLKLLLDRNEPFGGYLGLEPDPDTFQRLENFVGTLPAGLRQKVTTRQCAVAAESGSLRFDAAGSVASGISMHGNIEVQALTLDGLLGSNRAGLIKMDIEGAELEALNGARSILARDRPILAISAYHRASDLWTIPLLIKSIVPDYELYLRRYAEDFWELICYAIHPSSRLAKKMP